MQPRSGCVKGQVFFTTLSSDRMRLSRIMAFSRASSFRMQATIVTLKDLPAARSRSAKRLSTGLQRMAVSVPMYRTQRTWTRVRRG